MKCVILVLCCICATLAAPSEVELPLRLLALGNRQFAAAVYKEVVKTNSGNLIFSPFSIETVLALTSEGAKTDTRKELLSALYLPDAQVKIQEGFKEILPKLNLNNETIKLLAANKIYAAKNLKLEDEFKKVAVEVYNSAVENVDFADNVNTADIINHWVEKQTNDKIKNLLKPDKISSDTAIVLINALYLSAKWQSPFSNWTTRNEKFHKSATEAAEVPMMVQADFFPYSYNKELDTQFLELKYDADDLSMVIALPNKKEGLAGLESNMEKVFEPQPWTEEAVKVKLPKFSIDSQIECVDILKALGAKKIFDPIEADLTGFVVNSKDLYVSDVVQKAFINVTESGTEAAAATLVLIETRSGGYFPLGHKKFFVDHPFIYFIKYGDIILFAGRYNA